VDDDDDDDDDNNNNNNKEVHTENWRYKIIKYKKEETLMLIDVAIPAERNISQKKQKRLNTKVYA
jgi:hypothetical protein